jgi:hypothetical protein
MSFNDATWSGHPTSAIATCMVEATQQQSVSLASISNENYKIIRKAINCKEQKRIYKVQLKLTHQTMSFTWFTESLLPWSVTISNTFIDINGQQFL